MNDNPTGRRARFALAISAERYLDYYQGRAQAVIVTAADGRTLQLPAGVLQRFVTHDGIRGLFEIEFDANNKFVAIHRLGNQ